MGNRYRIALGHIAISDDPQVDPAKIPVSKVGHRHEAQGICAKAGPKLLTPVVRSTRDFQNGSPNLESTSDRQVFARKIQLGEQLVAEQPQGLTVGDEFGNLEIHHGELGVGTAFRIPEPLVSLQAGLDAHMPARYDFV